MTNNPIYFDNAATTPLCPGVLDAMLPYFNSNFGNPSGVCSFARTARKGIDAARSQIAAAINAQPNEITFTSSGTEANNWAIRGVFNKKAGHIITSVTEHHAVGHVCEVLEGVDVTYLPVDSEGFVSPEALKAAIRPDTALISIMWANNEIGTIQPIAELAEIARERGILFHTDAVQVVGHIPVDMEKVPVDMLTMSAHKFGGPKGIGALYVRKGTKLGQLIYGGAQERNRRAGTENVAGIVGMGTAIELAVSEQEAEFTRISALRDELIKQIEDNIPRATLNGSRGEKRLPGNINFSFDFIEGESLLLLLDMNGFCASSGSACSSASLEPSHVIMALGVPYENAHGSIRFSLGRESKLSDINSLMEHLPKFIQRLRDMSPLDEKSEKAE